MLEYDEDEYSSDESSPSSPQAVLESGCVQTNPALSGLNTEQLTLVYAITLARKMGMELCTCPAKLRCKVCLNCMDTHCVCKCLQQHGQQKQVSTGGAQVTLIEDVARFLAGKSGRNPTPQQREYLASRCSVCHTSVSAVTGGLVQCEHCSITYHVSCLQILADNAPDGPWFCKSCFPQGEYLYYPPLKAISLTAIDRARVVQIVLGEASRLSEDAKLAYVEDYVRRTNLGNGMKFFLFNKKSAE